MVLVFFLLWSFFFSSFFLFACASAYVKFDCTEVTLWLTEC